MFGPYLQAVRQAHPLIPGITNYVTANACAAGLLFRPEGRPRA